MFDLVLGLPVHPLVVHVVVVLLPIMSILSIAVAARASWRPHFRWVVLGDLVLALACFVADQSGDALEERLNATRPAGYLGEHDEWGSRTVMVGMLLFVVSLVTWWALRSQRFVLPAVGLITIVALTALTFTVLAGHSGATAAWKPVVAATGGTSAG